MGRKIRITKRANISFNSILDYINQKFGKTASENFLKRTYSFFDILLEYPQIGTLEDKSRKIHAFVIEKQTTVFYRFNDKEVIVLNFFDNRKRPSKK